MMDQFRDFQNQEANDKFSVKFDENYSTKFYSKYLMKSNKKLDHLLSFLQVYPNGAPFGVSINTEY